MKYITRALIALLLTTLVVGILLVVLYGHRDIPLDTLKEKYANEQSAFISVDGMEVHYRDEGDQSDSCLLYTSPSPRDRTRSRMPSSA